MSDPVNAEVKNIVEAALLAAGRALSVDELAGLFAQDEPRVERGEIRAVLAELAEGWEDRSLELNEVASGYRFQVRTRYGQWMARLWAERPPRYSRALLETLALIAYRQPITRGGIEEVRGVSVAGSIVKTLLEREWIRVVGHKEVAGRPALYGTTREFLDSFGLKSLDGLPPLSELADPDRFGSDLFAALEPEVRPEVATPGSPGEPGPEVILELGPDEIPGAARGPDPGTDDEVDPGVVAGAAGDPP